MKYSLGQVSRQDAVLIKSAQMWEPDEALAELRKLTTDGQETPWAKVVFQPAARESGLGKRLEFLCPEPEKASVA